MADGAFGQAKPGPWTAYLEGADVCINLTGRSVNCRYTPDNRTEIYNSRIVSTRLLGNVIASLQHPPRVWLNASTATIYRHASDRPMDEKTGELGGGEPGAPDAWNFSIRVAKDWETTFFKADTPHTRKVAMRSAITFSPTPGNAFAVFKPRANRARWNPRQRPTVGLMDSRGRLRPAVEFFIAREDLEGPVNIASPIPRAKPGVHGNFRESGKCPMESPRRSPSSNWRLFHADGNRTGFKSRRVVPTRLLEAGFTFDIPKWAHAAEDLVQRWRESTAWPLIASVTLPSTSA